MLGDGVPGHAGMVMVGGVERMFTQRPGRHSSSLASHDISQREDKWFHY